MIFAAVPVGEAAGAILAHSIRLPDGVVKKGTVLTPDHAVALAAAGLVEVTVARLDATDVPEDEAAHALASAACGAGLRVATATTGRCNLYTDTAGVLRVDAAAINAANAIHEAITIATPPDYARLEVDKLAATAKIIPYAAPRAALAQATAVVADALTLYPFRPIRTALLVTRIDDQKDSVIDKGIRAVSDRLVSLGSDPPDAITLPHDETALTNAIHNAMRDDPELILILAATATSDRGDTAPAALCAAGGTIHRFGMPVDPGNLLVLGEIDATPAIILPGCARSPALNGADWVLERFAARLPLTPSDIAAMGVGGLLKEMPGRPHPREKRR